jgi:hypothetical protein
VQSLHATAPSRRLPNQGVPRRQRSRVQEAALADVQEVPVPFFCLLAITTGPTSLDDHETLSTLTTFAKPKDIAHMQEHDEQGHPEAAADDRRQPDGAGEFLPAVTTNQLEDAIRSAARDIVIQVLEDQAATFVADGCVLDLHGTRRALHRNFVADIIASRVTASALAAIHRREREAADRTARLKWHLEGCPEEQ